MRNRVTERQLLQTDLQHAIARGELRLEYQPIVELQSCEIIGMEALLRWHHPERGLIAHRFHPARRGDGVIVPIGRWVFREACRQAADWQRTIPGRERLAIAINVSGRQLQHPDGSPRTSSGRSPRRGNRSQARDLEITESLFLTDTDTIHDQLDELKRLGVYLAIDDFGTGYSSLSYLSHFPLDVMKIDKSFLVEDTVDHRHAFIRSIIEMGHTLRMLTLAEGIETSAELELLRDCGCDFGQGFFFDRPLTPETPNARRGTLPRCRRSGLIAAAA